MPKRTTDYRSSLLEDLKDPREASNYLTAALQDTEEMFLVALRDVAEARTIASVAEAAGLSRESLYRMLSPSGNPTYRSLIGILRALGIGFEKVATRGLLSSSEVLIGNEESLGSYKTQHTASRQRIQENNALIGGMYTAKDIDQGADSSEPPRKGPGRDYGNLKAIGHAAEQAMMIGANE